MGVAVAAFILWSGWGLVMDTLSPLLGETPSPELVAHIERTVMSYPGVLGVHDLMVHDYGPGHQFASLHVEFPAESDPLAAHDVIDNIERDFLKKDNLQVTIHYDPIVTSDAKVGVLRTRLTEHLRQLDPQLSIHDLRIVPGDTHTNVLFDLPSPPGTPAIRTPSWPRCAASSPGRTRTTAASSSWSRAMPLCPKARNNIIRGKYLC